MKKLIKKIKYILSKTIVLFCYLMPIKKNKIVFINFFGKGFGCNPKYIAQEFLKDKNYDLVWIVENINDDSIPEKIRKVKINSFREKYELITAKVWVFNIRNYHPVKKRKKHVYLQTWHGGFGAKPAEKDIEDKLSLDYINMAKKDGKMSDGIISDSELMTALYERAYWLSENTEILKIGLPRNDYLYNNYNNRELRKETRKLYNIMDDDYVILYAPTFRDDGSFECYSLDYNNVIGLFEQKFSRPVKIIVRLHPNVDSKKLNIQYTDKVINGSGFSDIQSLSIACDCCISDYSSIIFDFSNFYKLVLLYVPDEKKYIGMRGVNKEYYELPFSRVYDNEYFAQVIADIDVEEYKMKVASFMAKYPTYNQGKSSKECVDWIKKRMQN